MDDLPAAAAASTRAFGPLRLIVDPRAGRDVSGTTLTALRGALDIRGVAHDVAIIGADRSAGALARAALEEGVRYLAAVGDDGTIHHVLNGMFDDIRPIARDAVLGVVAVGRGSDFARNFGLDRGPEVIAGHLASDHEMVIDVGTVDYRDVDGRAARRVFANLAQVGYGADCVRLAGRMPSFLGRVRHLFAAYGAMLGMDHREVEVAVDQAAAVMPVVNVVVANGQFVSGGMKVAPRALADDGRFNVQVFTGQRSQVFLLTQRIYRGEHLPDPDIREWQSASVSVAAPPALAVEADGTLLGTTPASFGLLPRTLRLKI